MKLFKSVIFILVLLPIFSTNAKRDNRSFAKTRKILKIVKLKKMPIEKSENACNGKEIYNEKYEMCIPKYCSACDPVNGPYSIYGTYTCKYDDGTYAFTFSCL